MRAAISGRSLFIAIGLVGGVFNASCRPPAGVSPLLSLGSGPSHAARQGVSAGYTLPIGFEPNLGQTDAEVRFLSRGNGYTLFLTQTDAIVSLRANRDEAPPFVPPASSHRHKPGAARGW